LLTKEDAQQNGFAKACKKFFFKVTSHLAGISNSQRKYRGKHKQDV